MTKRAIVPATVLIVTSGLVAAWVWAAPAKPVQTRKTIDLTKRLQRRTVKKNVYTRMLAAERLTATFPDLVIDDVRLAPAAGGGARATVVVNVRNQGTAQAHGFYTNMEISRGSESMVQWCVLTPLEPDGTTELEYEIAALDGRTDLSLVVDPPTEERPFGCQLEGVPAPDQAVATLPGEENNTASAVYSGDPAHPTP